MELARAEYDRVVRALAGLAPDDWAKPTDCPEWDVRELACHLAGMVAMASDPGETARQRESAGPEHARRGGPMIDSITAVQVRERAHPLAGAGRGRGSATGPGGRGSPHGALRPPYASGCFPRPTGSTASRSGGASATSWT